MKALTLAIFLALPVEVMDLVLDGVINTTEFAVLGALYLEAKRAGDSGIVRLSAPALQSRWPGWAVGTWGRALKALETAGLIRRYGAGAEKGCYPIAIHGFLTFEGGVQHRLDAVATTDPAHPVRRACKSGGTTDGKGHHVGHRQTHDVSDNIGDSISDTTISIMQNKKEKRKGEQESASPSSPDGTEDGSGRTLEDSTGTSTCNDDISVEIDTSDDLGTGEHQTLTDAEWQALRGNDADDGQQVVDADVVEPKTTISASATTASSSGRSTPSPSPTSVIHDRPADRTDYGWLQTLLQVTATSAGPVPLWFDDEPKKPTLAHQRKADDHRGACFKEFVRAFAARCYPGRTDGLDAAVKFLAERFFPNWPLFLTHMKLRANFKFSPRYFLPAMHRVEQFFVQMGGTKEAPIQTVGQLDLAMVRRQYKQKFHTSPDPNLSADQLSELMLQKGNASS